MQLELIDPSIPFETDETLARKQAFPSIVAGESFVFDEGEANSLATIPTVDPKTYKKNLSALGHFGQGLKGAIIDSATSGIQHTMYMTGYKTEKYDFGLATVDSVGKKLRTTGLALNAVTEGMKGTKDTASPDGYGEKLAEAIGGGAGTWLAMYGVSLGVTAATAPVLGPAAPIAGMAAGLAVSVTSEQKGMFETLTAGGIDPEIADTVAGAYGLVVGTIDYLSFKQVSRVLGPVLKKAALGAATKMGLLAAGEGVLMEAGTETLQETIAIGTEKAMGVNKESIPEVFERLSLSFITGGLIGGIGGFAGQRASRGEMIQKLTDTGMAKAEAAPFVDAYLLQLNDLAYDKLNSEADAALAGELSERMRTIDAQLAKITGQSTEVLTQTAEESIVAKEYGESVKTVLDAETVLADAKSREVLAENVKIQRERRALQSKAAEQTLQRRLIKIDPEKTFQEEMGRPSKPGEIGPWAVEKAAKLETAIAKTAQVAESLEGRMAEAQGAFGERIKDLPSPQKIANTQKALQEKYNRQSELIEKAAKQELSEEEASEQETVNRQIEAMEQRIENYATAPEAMEAAEKKVESLGTELVSKGAKIDQLTKQLVELRANPLEAFLAEKNQMPKGDELNTWLAQKVDEYTKEIQALQTEADQLTQEVVLREELAEDYRQGINRVEGKVVMTASQIRQMARQDLANVVTAYKAGRKATLEEVKRVQKAFRTLMRGMKLTPRMARQLLTSVLATRTAKQFNDRMPQLIGKLEKILSIEKVEKYRALAERILTDMTNDKKVSPEMVKFGKHLWRLWKGKAEPIYDGMSNDPATVAKATMEESVIALRLNEGDVTGATIAVTSLANNLRDNMKTYLEWEMQRKQTKERMVLDTRKSLEKGFLGAEGDRVQDAVARSFTEVRAENRPVAIWSFPFLTTSYDAFVRLIARGETESKVGTSQTERNLDPTRAHMAFTIGQGNIRENLDRTLKAIYGKNYEKLMSEHAGQDFVEVVLSDGRSFSITKSQAMSLWMMMKMPKVRESLISDNMILEAWLESFENQEIGQLSPQDMEFLEHTRIVLDEYFARIAPVYERQTGKVLQGIDQYFMTKRIMEHIGKKDDLEMSMLDMVEEDQFVITPEMKSALKKRTGGDMPFMIPDILQSLHGYMHDMEHFIAYADFVQRARWVYSDGTIRAQIEKYLGSGYMKLIDKFVTDMARGSPVGAVEKKSAQRAFSILAKYARTKLTTPKQLLRQLTGIAGFTDLQGIGAIELTQAALDLPRAIQSGELDTLLKTQYMQERYAGAFDFAAKFVKEMAKWENYEAAKKAGIRGKIERQLSSKWLYELTTIASRTGDKWSSVIGGWAVYRKGMQEHGDPKRATAEAILAIDKTQQPLYNTTLPAIYSETGFAPRLWTLFARTPGVYLDRYLQVMRDLRFTAQKEGLGTFSALVEGSGRSRVSYKDIARTILTYHVWVPMFETMFMSGGWDDDEFWINSAAGPFAYHLLLGRAMQAFLGTLYSFLDDEAELPKFLTSPDSSNMVDTLFRDMVKAQKAFQEMLEYPDYDTMWETTKKSMAVADVSGLPLGYTSRLLEGAYELLQGDPDLMPSGVKKMFGFSEYVAEKEQE
jgi:hypothetical protein